MLNLNATAVAQATSCPHTWQHESRLLCNLITQSPTYPGMNVLLSTTGMSQTEENW